MQWHCIYASYASQISLTYFALYSKFYVISIHSKCIIIKIIIIRASLYHQEHNHRNSDAGIIRQASSFSPISNECDG